MTKVLADIIVPTYNRHQELVRFFNENSKLSDLPVMVWIIDDRSNPSVVDLIPPWRNINFIQLKKNAGQAAARNIAIRKGTAPVVISLDDDAWFIDPVTAIQEIFHLFEAWPKAGCIMFNVATPDSEFSRVMTGTKLALHVTCGCAYRREVLDGVGGFSGFLHSQAEETDLSLRIYRYGFEIILAENIKIFHNFVPSKRPSSWYLKARHNTTRNDLLIVWMYFPAIVVLPALVIKIVSHLKFAILNRVEVLRTMGSTLLAGLDFIRMTPEAWRYRRPFTLKQWLGWYRLQRSSLGYKSNNR